MPESKKKILIIDDAIDNQLLLTMILEAGGYQVESTSNGEEALSLLRKSSDLPDLILLDAQMPIMDGYQFRIQQRLDARLRELPVVVMTGDDDLTINKKMLDPLAIMQKPLKISALTANLSFYLSKGVSKKLKPRLVN